MKSKNVTNLVLGAIVFGALMVVFFMIKRALG